MMTALWKMERLPRGAGFFALGLAILAALLASGCYIPGLGALGDASDPPANTDPTGVDETYYGKFLIYQVGGGKLDMFTRDDSKIPYIVGETYFPSNVPAENLIYNRNHYGNGQFLYPGGLPSGAFTDPLLTYDPTQTFFYRNEDGTLQISGVPASSRPEGIVLNGSLSLYYTNFSFFDVRSLAGIVGAFQTIESNCGSDAGGSTPIAPNVIYIAVFNAPFDVDVYDLDIAAPGVVVFRGRWSLLNSGSDEHGIQFRHRMKLTLEDDSGNVLAASSHGPDDWMYVDPEISYGFTVAGTYHLMVQDLLGNGCDGAATEDTYWLFVESPNLSPDLNRIMKGKLMPARSGNPLLNGGPTFEPDDLSTRVLDDWPDCDGIPGTGDEGDAGIYERCGSPSDLGARDGRLEYQEVDDKTAIDDGEYFQGEPTNVGTALDSESSLLNAPDRDSLLMFVNYGSRIYMLESLDGQQGLKWDLSNITNDRPSIVPRQYSRVPGDPNSPVVSSGPLGFCETIPDPNDLWGATVLEAFANAYGDSVTATGAVPNAPTGYPWTYAITFGGNNHLDSTALADVQVGDTINSGPDGIINTFLAPRYVAYNNVPISISIMDVRPFVLPGDTIAYGLNGPGNPDDPALYILTGATAGYMHPLATAAYGGSNQSGFLLKDDVWNPAVFTGDTVGATVPTPPAYMQKQRCNFYNLGHSFNKCAYGVPVDENGEEPPAIQAGGDGRLDTVAGLLSQYGGDDHLCHDGDTVAVCAGPDGRFGFQDIYIPIKGDDRLEIVRDTAHTWADFPGLVAQTPSSSAYWRWVHDAMTNITPGSTTNPWPERLVIGIGSGPDHVLQTQIIDSNTTVDPDRWIAYLGADRLCETLDGYPAICPGVEVTLDLYSFNGANWSGVPRDPAFVMPMPMQTRKILSVWPMYFNSNTISSLFDNSEFLLVRIPRGDDYGIADDVFCMIGGELGICTGGNGYFQSYPLSRRVKIDEDKELFTLYRRDAGYVGQDCYSMVSEKEQKAWEKDATVYYRIYQDLGLRGDDRLKWSAARGYFITTGPNGISQSCMSKADARTVHHVNGQAVTIGFNKGLPNVPIISAGGNGVLDTYPLADQKIYWGDNVYKVSSGRDGVSNSFAMGDDRLEILMGTGQPDYPCVRSGDGIADTYAQKNDSQLYDPGDPLDPADNEKTGFDAFNVWGPDALAVGNKIYLYYTALGWTDEAKSTRDGRGSLGSLGECRRAGMDHQWGQIKQDLTRKAAPENEGSMPKSIYAYEFALHKEQFRRLLDNNPGVVLAPRIGVATSTIGRLRADPGDWDFRDQPALDTGRQCLPDPSSAIDLGFNFPVYPDINWNGAYSPDIKLTQLENGEGLLFLMFFTGHFAVESDTNSLETPNAQIAVARSLDGLNYEVVRDRINPLLLSPNFDLLGFFTGYNKQYAFPAVVSAGADQYGEPMYGMFFNHYISMGSLPSLGTFDKKTSDHIGYAVRKGKSNYSLNCSLRSSYWTDDSQRLRSILQLVILAIPLLLVLSVRLYRRSRP